LYQHVLLAKVIFMALTSELAAEDRFLTIAEAAEVFRVTPDTIYRACKQARDKKSGLRHYRIGRRAIRIRYGDLLAFTQNNASAFRNKVKKIAP